VGKGGGATMKKCTKATSLGGKLIFSCEVCGKEQTYDLPNNVGIVNALGKAFDKSHKACARKKEHDELGNMEK
jgi:hypothetical protein